MADKEPTKEAKTPPKRKPAAKQAPGAQKPSASKSTGSPSKNGSSASGKKKPPSSAPKAKPVAPAQAVDQAEHVLDDAGAKLGAFFAAASKSLRRTAAVAREELEDLWAEAQSIRRGDTK